MKFNTQRDATFYVVTEILKNNKIEFVPGKTDARPHFERKSPLRSNIVNYLSSLARKISIQIQQMQRD